MVKAILNNEINWTSIGVDPGKEGFITVLKRDSVEFFSIPKVGTVYDEQQTAQLILSIIESCNIKYTTVTIEDVHAIHGASAQSTFNFGGCVYSIRMAFIMCGLPLHLVAPKKWQKEMFEGTKPNPDKKVMSVLTAQRLFPNLDFRRTVKCVKADDNLTDSLLIAEYGRRNYL